jgi:hypothetical protein
LTGLAVEVLRPGPPIVFVGARVGRDDQLKLRVVGASDDWLPSQLREAVVGGPLGSALRAELGAINAWRSVGPLQLALDASISAVRDALSGRVDLLRCSHPVALEITHRQPREGWWAIEVSDREGTTHVVDVEKVVNALGWVTPGR